MIKALFLDDERIPQEVNWVRYPSRVHWKIVRTYDEFLAALQQEEFELISFDHDLGPGKSGYDALKALLAVCVTTNSKLPYCTFHTMNPVGRDNMRKLYGAYGI